MIEKNSLNYERICKISNLGLGSLQFNRNKNLEMSMINHKKDTICNIKKLQTDSNSACYSSSFIRRP